MTGRPSRRLIDAAATLDPADRALLNLWLHRGLDDERLAALTSMSPDAVGRRRERILGALSNELGLPEQDVAEALRALGLDGAGPGDASGPPGATAPPAATPQAPPAATPPAPVEATPPAPAEATPPAPVEAAQPAAPRRRGRVWLAITAAVALVVAAVLVILLSAGGSAGSGRRSAAVTTGARASETAAATTPDPSRKTTSAAARSGARVQALIALPGGLRHASGMVRLLGRGRYLKLRLTVRGLPHVRRGHYEAWLYNSVLDSRALGRVQARGTETYRLPRDAHRYTAIDISYQPRGSVNESGESRLRALDPAHYARRVTAGHTTRGHRATRHTRPRRQTEARHRRHRATRHTRHGRRRHHRRGSDSRTRKTR